jgi:copper chaperone
MENAVLKVEGMSCEHCVKAVKGAAESAGAKNVIVDLKKGTAAFDFDGTQSVLGAIKAAIEEQGYDIAK